MTAHHRDNPAATRAESHSRWPARQASGAAPAPS
jgi:hypothetical protein